MVKVKANELDAADKDLVQKLHKEVVHLRQVLNLRKKGKFEEIQLQLVKLQKENNRLRTLAENHEEVEKLKMENKYMRIELQKIREEEGSLIVRDDGGMSFTELNSNVNKTQAYELSSLQSKNIKDIERRIDNEAPMKCPLCKEFPPCPHYNEGSDYDTCSPMKRLRDVNPPDKVKPGVQNKSFVPALARSREKLLDEGENAYRVIDTDSKFNTGTIEMKSAKGRRVKLREAIASKSLTKKRKLSE